jgi:hypothetical protein
VCDLDNGDRKSTKALENACDGEEGRCSCDAFYKCDVQDMRSWSEVGAKARAQFSSDTTANTCKRVVLAPLRS